MKRKNVLLLLLAVVIGVIMYYSFDSEGNRLAYIDEIAAYRMDKDEDMRSGEESPFAPDSIAYNGLQYFDPNLDFKVKAKLVPIENKKIRTLSTSDGKTKQYLEYAYAEFEIDEKPQRLLILEMTAAQFEGHLFLAFGDATSAIETYGAGRYIELEKGDDDTIEIDFNLAYNPYCAYTEGYSCPFPPSENLLTVAITAGEKNYHKE